MKKSRRSMRKLWAFILAFAVVGSTLGQHVSTVSAEEAGSSQTEETQGVTEENAQTGSGEGGEYQEAMPETVVRDEEGILPDNDELFEGYLQQQMYAGFNDGIATLGNFGEQALTGLNLKIYGILKEELADIAAGTSASASIDISVEKLELEQTTWTAEELGITTGDQISGAISAKLKELGYDLSSLFDCLMADCPYELYWFDKTAGVNSATGTFRYTVTSNGTVGSVTWDGPITFSFTVAEEYRPSGSGDAYTVDTGKTSAASAAVAKAESIVNSYAGSSDYEKLVGYKNEICELVSYNTGAAADSSTPYGNPWQLIWVFDENESTNVVCEGYAKAFQYLCDLTDFSNDNIVCYTVTGTMSGGTGAGRHMWNIVTMEDGKNYLVDVTNCDAGTVGAPDKLFLAGLSGKWDTGYTYTSGSTAVTYVYDNGTNGTDDVLSMYGETILTLSESGYTYTPPRPSVSVSGNQEITYGDTLTLTANVSNISGTVTYQWQQKQADGTYQALDGQTGATCTIQGLNAGDAPYEFRVSVNTGNTSIESDSFQVKVNKQTINIAGIKWDTSGSPFTYDGQKKSVQLSGTWPEDAVNVTVSGNEAADAGTYNAEAVFSLKSGYEGNYALSGTATVSAEWRIDQASPAYSAPTGLTAIYGQKLSDIRLPEAGSGDTPGTWSWEDPDASVGNVGTRTFKAVFTPDDTKNYKTVTEDVEVTVSAEPLTGSAALNGDAVYGEKLTAQASGTQGDAQLIYSFYREGTDETVQTGRSPEYVLGAQDVGKTISVKVTADNYSGSLDSDSTAEVARRPVTVTAETKSKTYGSQDPELTYQVSDSTPMAEGDKLNGTLSRQQGEDAGEYEISQGTLTNENNPCYDITFYGAEFSIQKADYNGTTSAELSAGYRNAMEYDLAAFLPEGFKIGEITVTDEDGILDGVPSVTGTVFSWKMGGEDKVGKTAQVQILVTETKNYNPFVITVTITMTDKLPQNLSFESAALNKTYGNEDFTNALTGAAGGSSISYTSSDPAVAEVDGTGRVHILKAGTAVITAAASETADYAAGSISYTLTVSPITLTWDTSDLTAVDKVGNITDRKATLYGSLKVSGILSSDTADAVFTCSADKLIGTYASTAAGTQRVTLTWADADGPVTLQGEKAGNYVLPEALPEITGTIHTAEDLPTPPESTDDRQYRLEAESGISEVPEALKNIERLNTPAKIETEMKLAIQNRTGDIPEANIAVYDVTLMININGTGWVPATEENFPAEGVTVTLPYPSGTGKDSHDFTVAHMFTTDANGKKAGDVEYPEVTKTDAGIQFKVFSLSPISVGWKAVEQTSEGGQNVETGAGSGGNGGGTQNSGSAPAQTSSVATGDNSPIALYVILLAAAVIGIGAAAATGKKRRDK